MSVEDGLQKAKQGLVEQTGDFVAIHKDDDLEQQTTTEVGNLASDGSDNELQIEASLFPIDRYKPIKQLGRGALGKVFLCDDLHLKKKVAVKCLHVIAGAQVISFQQEARIASRLNHDNVIKILDFGTSQSGQPFMVMEYFDGRSLQEIIAEHGKISNSPAIEIFLQVCSALQHLHSHDVFHRDLKPSNILVNFSKSGTPSIKLIDFGLSKSTIQDRSGIEVQGRTIVGTPAYMSPDQVEGNIFDASSEIYSFGCVLHEMFSGRPPFVGETAIEILNKHVNETPPSLTESAPEVTSGICRIVEKCLRKNRSERYQSIAEIIDDWNEFQSTASITDATTVKTPTARKHLRLNTILPATAIVLSCLVATVLIVFRTVPFQNLNRNSIRIESIPNIRDSSKVKNTAFNQLLDSSKRTELFDTKVSDSTGFRLLDEVGSVSSTHTDKLLDSKADDREDVVLRFVSNDETIKKLAHRKSLKHLDLSEGSLTDRAFKDLAALPNLTSLRLNRTNVKTLDGIGKLVNLQRLELKNTAITDNSLSQLKSLKKLVMLNLSTTDISDAGVEKLFDLPNLQDLLLGSTLVTPAIADMVSRIPLVSIGLARTAVDEKAVRKIAEMSSIMCIDITGCEKISSAERLRLESDFPTISFEPKASYVQKLLHSAAKRVARRDFRGALNEYQRCENKLAERYGKDSPKLILCNLRISLCALSLNQFELAKQVLIHTEQVAQRARSQYEVLAATDQLTTLYSSTDSKLCLPTATRALKLAERLKAAPLDIANRYFMIGELYFRQLRWKESEAAFLRSIALVEKLKGKNAREAASSIVRLAECRRQVGRDIDAVVGYKRAIAILSAVQPTVAEKNEIGFAYTGLAAIDLRNRKLSEALKNNGQAIMYFAKHRLDPMILHVVHGQRGKILSELGRTKEAQVERDTASTFQSPVTK